MQFPPKNTYKRTTSLIFALLIFIASASFAQAQNTSLVELLTGKTSEDIPTTDDVASTQEVSQCANIGFPACDWVFGNLNHTKSDWVEGDFVPYRIILSDVPAGPTVHTITIAYDTTESGGEHAIDYVGTYNYTLGTANPCQGVTGCSLAPSTTWPIPTDSRVLNGQNQLPGGGDDIIQIPGVFTLFGGTITGVSGPNWTGTFAAASTASYTISFTRDGPTVPVLAWGGHISTRIDWGIGNSAVSFSGSPYHMRRGPNGADRSLSVSAVTFPATVTVVKVAQPFGGGTATTTEFPFTATNFDPAAFSLVDDDGGPGEDSKSNETPIVLFGAGNEITITEGSPAAPGWSLGDLDCVHVNGGLGIGTHVYSPPSVTLTLKEGEFVTCTFTNQQLSPSAAPANISGRVTTATGYPISRARLTLFNLNTNETHTVYTNAYGRYLFAEMPVADFYVMSIDHKRYNFIESTREFTLTEDIANMDFVTSP